MATDDITPEMFAEMAAGLLRRGDKRRAWTTDLQRRNPEAAQIRRAGSVEKGRETYKRIRLEERIRVQRAEENARAARAREGKARKAAERMTLTVKRRIERIARTEGRGAVAIHARFENEVEDATWPDNTPPPPSVAEITKVLRAMRADPRK
jgi:hypothetical protein